MMKYQIEVTTHCNSDCFYCPQVRLAKQHMTFDVFNHIIKQFTISGHVLLQGTGEPLLHPKFWEMVNVIKQQGHFTGIITNGTKAITQDHVKKLDSIGFSIDTLCKETAKKSGRNDPQQTLKHLLECYDIAPTKVGIFAVHYGQDMQPLISFAKSHKISLTVQNLQTKTSYQGRYYTTQLPYRFFRCHFIEQERMHYYFVDGTVAPCCYMTDKEYVLPREEIKSCFEEGTVPQCCEYCGVLTGQSRIKRFT